MNYRPWGPIDWALTLSSQKPWRFVGAIGTEERSLCCWTHLRGRQLLVGELFAQIRHIDSEKYREKNRNLLALRRSEFEQHGGSPREVRAIDLMAEWFQINTFAHEAESLGTSVVLDITSYPKRFFFPLLQRLATSEKVKNLMLTYTSPAMYADDAPLYEEPEEWRTLPGFGGTRENPDIWVVSIGFLAESLRNYIGDNPNKKMKMLIPFPAPLAMLRRTWQSVVNLEQGHSDSRFDKYRVEALDMSAAFDRIRSIAGDPAKCVAFAPFGPKPTSAAMCLYAIQMNSSVHYPQPTIYHPEYSRGIQNNEPGTAVSGYWIKHEGEFLYSV